jgi:hemolysin activation/secretion protein
MKHFLICIFLIILGLNNAAGICLAQDNLKMPRSVHPSDERPELPGYLPEQKNTPLKLPPLPPAPDSMAAGPGFELKGLVFEGNTVFSHAALLAVADSFLNTRVTLTDLEEIRYRLTRKYVDNGYINSGVLLKPGQVIDKGVVVFQVLEGRLDGINVAGNRRLKPAYITDRIWPDAQAVFHVPLLREQFQLLLQDPLIKKMDGRIRPGSVAGQAFLDLEVARARPYDLALTVDNHRSPSTGSTGADLSGTLWNLSGFGDRLDLSLGGSEGSLDLATRLDLPINSRGTRVFTSWDQSDNSVIEAPLDDVDIESESRSFDVGLSHGFIHTLGRSLEAGITLSLRKSQTFLWGDPFSFSSGADDGESRVSALRFFQSFTDRTPDHALILRSTFSTGLDLFDATVHSDGRPDGQYLAWLGQVQFAGRLGDRFGQVIFRGDIQLADDNLLSLEQFALGGGDSVRGYRENERVRDNGIFLSLEWRYPLWEKPGEKRLEAAVFTDFGSAWNKGEGTDQLHSAGLGLLWQINAYARAQIYWAHDLKEASEKYEYDLQDDGVHFSFTLDFFPDKG